MPELLTRATESDAAKRETQGWRATNPSPLSCAPDASGYNHAMKLAIAQPHDVRAAILTALAQEGRSKYAFAKQAADSGICQHHTVDSVLAPPESSTHTTPTLPTAIRLLHEAGYDLIAVRR